MILILCQLAWPLSRFLRHPSKCHHFSKRTYSQPQSKSTQLHIWPDHLRCSKYVHRVSLVYNNSLPHHDLSKYPNSLLKPVGAPSPQFTERSTRLLKKWGQHSGKDTRRIIYLPKLLNHWRLCCPSLLKPPMVHRDKWFWILVQTYWKEICDPISTLGDSHAHSSLSTTDTDNNRLCDTQWFSEFFQRFYFLLHNFKGGCLIPVQDHEHSRHSNVFMELMDYLLTVLTGFL